MIGTPSANVLLLVPGAHKEYLDYHLTIFTRLDIYLRAHTRLSPNSEKSSENNNYGLLADVNIATLVNDC